MKKVLVPFDGSQSSQRALKYLIDASAHYQSLEVHLLNVQPTLILHGDYFAQDMLAKLDQAARKHGEDINAQAMAQLAGTNIAVVSHVTIGEVVSEVSKTVQELGCDTVVMGTRGMSNFSNLVLGSVASRVVHEVAVPVLLVK